MPNDNLKPAESEELLKCCERLLMASAEAVNALLTEADSSAGIARALSIIGRADEVDRVYIFENHADPKTGAMLTSQRHEWAREGVTAQIANPAMQNLEYMQVFKRWYDVLVSGQPISGLIRDFPEQERPLLESQDIISILAVPIKIGEQLWGFIGFDDCRRERLWTPAEIAILTAISANIAHLLLQRRTDQSLKHFLAALDGTGDAIGMADMQGHHFYQNKAFTDLFGYTVEELEKAGGPRVTFHDQVIHHEVFKTILAGGSWHGELEMRSRSGRIMSILLRADAIKGNDGKPFAVFGIHTDITERKKTERIIHEGEVRYRRLIESTTDYIYTVTVENGRAVNTYHGPSCIGVTGYSSEEYKIDRDLWFKMVHPDDRQKVLDQAQQVLKGATTLPLEHRIYHKNGTIRWVRNTPVPHFDSSGKLVSYDGLVYDVTDRKNAEEQIKAHANKLEILNRIITAVNRVDNLNMLLNESLKASMEMVLFDGGGIYLVNPDNSTAELVCHQGLPEDFIRKAGVLQTSAANCRMLFVEGNPIFSDNYSLISSERSSEWNIQSVARIPLISKDKVIGAMALINSKGHTFNENEKELLLSIGRQIGTAIAKMRSETALRESERRYRTITEQSLVGIQIIKDGLVTFVNDGWTKITGYNSADMANWDVEEYLKIVHPGDRPMFAEQARKKQLGTEDGTFPIYDCRFLCKKGETKWVSIYSQGVEFGNGRAIVGMIVDITERKRLEGNLKKEQQELTLILDSSPIIVFYKDKEGKIMRVNKAFAEALKMLKEEFVGKTLFDLFSAKIAQGMIADDEEVIKSGRPKLNIIEQYESASGLRWVQTDKTPIYNENGAVVGLVGFAQDITNRKKAEEELLLHSKIIANMTEGVYLVRASDGLIVYANPKFESMFGYLPGEMCGRHVSIVNAPVEKDPRETADEIMGILEKNGEWHGEVLNIKKDGTSFWCYANSAVFNHAEYGKVIVDIHTDITERKQAEAALVAANKQLTTINEHLSRREQELLKANAEKEVLLKEIHHRVKNNLQIINSLINLQIHNIADRNAVGLLKECQSRIKTIAMVHEKMYQIGDLARVDIGGYLDSLTRHINHMYLTDTSSVAIKVNAKGICLPIDQAIPCALLVNELVVNSLKHAFPEHLSAPAIGGSAKAGKAGEVNISMFADESGHYILTVSDNGIGLPSGTDYRNTKSLGMQLVKTFVNQLQGTLELGNKPQASSASGETTPRRAGTSFIISFAQSRKDG